MSHLAPSEMQGGSMNIGFQVVNASLSKRQFCQSQNRQLCLKMLYFNLAVLDNRLPISWKSIPRKDSGESCGKILEKVVGQILQRILDEIFSRWASNKVMELKQCQSFLQTTFYGPGWKEYNLSVHLRETFSNVDHGIGSL